MAEACNALAAVVLWLALGFSLGWYYTFTYYGRTGIPIPVPEGIFSIILYYFSVVNTALWLEAVHWMVVFPVAGFVWVAIITLTAPYCGGTRPPFFQTLFRISCASIPVILPAPFMMYMAGCAGREHFVFERAVDVALRKGNIVPPDWLTPLYLGLGAVSLVIQLWTCRHRFGLVGLPSLRHYLLALAGAICVVCILGAVVSLPLRWCLE